MRLALLLVLLLAGCAQNPIKQGWDPGETYWDRARIFGAKLVGQDKSERFIPAKTIDNLLVVRGRLMMFTEVSPILVIVETDAPNAFAWNKGSVKYVAFSVNFLEKLGHDVDALATTMGHEMAHLELKHGEKREGRDGAKQAVGFALGFFLGPLGTVADVGSQAIFNSFTRDEEREADALGMKWALEAGYSPCGQAKVAAMFAKFGTGQIPFLSSHPGYEERGQAAEKAAGKSCN